MQDKQLKGNIVFKETQRFSQPWIWLLLLSPVLFSIGVTVFALSQEEGREAWFVIPLVLVLNFAILYGFYVSRLELVVTDWGIFYRWRPFSRKYRQISRFDIQSAEIRKSPFLRIGSKRMVIGYGHVNQTGTREGIQFRLYSGKKIFIGSEKVKSFYRAVENLVQTTQKIQ